MIRLRINGQQYTVITLMSIYTQEGRFSNNNPIDSTKKNCNAGARLPSTHQLWVGVTVKLLCVVRNFGDAVLLLGLSILQERVNPSAQLIHLLRVSHRGRLASHRHQ